MSRSGSPPTEEFALGEPQSPGTATAGGPEAGPAGPSRRRSSPGWRHSPGLWVTLAVLLVVVGAAVSPQGEPLEPRPPEEAWTASGDLPGRAPDVWVLSDRPVVAAADGLTAFDPSTGEVAWTAPIDDPACTVTDQVLTCVHGEGESAGIATIAPDGTVTEQPFPGADVAVSAGDDLIVAGGTASNHPWLGRFTGTGSAESEAVWRYEPEHTDAFDQRWDSAIVSQGIVTVSASAGASDRARHAGSGLAADLETGVPRPAVVRSQGGTGVSYTAETAEQWNQVVQPLPGPEAAVPGYPDAVFTGRGAFDTYGGDRILDYQDEPLLAVEGGVIIVGLDPDLRATLEPGEEVELATRTERLDVRSGETRWQLDRDQLVGCPCASSGDSIILTASVIRDADLYTAGPVALLGIDPGTGRHHWALPISTAPDAIAAGSDHGYVLTGSTLAAYFDR